MSVPVRDGEGISLRPIAASDMAFLEGLYGSTRERELSLLDWPAERRRAFIRQQFEAQHAYWQENYRDTSWDLVLRDGQPVGRLYVARWPDEIRVVDISLSPEHRGRGIGTRLLRRILDEADVSGRRVSIHVESHNPARRLYERLGFRQAGENGVYLLMERVPGVAAG